MKDITIDQGTQFIVEAMRAMYDGMVDAGMSPGMAQRTLIVSARIATEEAERGEAS